MYFKSVIQVKITTIRILIDLLANGRQSVFYSILVLKFYSVNDFVSKCLFVIMFLCNFFTMAAIVGEDRAIVFVFRF